MKFFITLFLAVLCTLPHGVAQAKPRPLTAPQTQDAWRSVRTNHLFVIGNADAEKLRQVATWLEFFHSSFARLVSRNVLDASVPTTVIIFRDDASFTPYKPLYNGRPANISGFFQPGDEVNYIALSLDPAQGDPYSTAFHEYVHLHIRDNVPNAPVWLNEGLAELYGSLQFSGNDALLGAPINLYLNLLREHELLPLTTLLSINTNSPHYNEQDKSGIFYGESWALVHYLMLGERGRQEQFKSFLQKIGRGEEVAKSIEDSFGVSLAVLEQDLRTYVRRGNFTAQRIANVDNPQAYTSYTAMQRSSLSDSETNYYLGDLLLHSGRANEAERYFKRSIALDRSFTLAYAALGQLYVHQRRYSDAKMFLERATAAPQNYLIHYLYAYVLSREGMSTSGQVNERLQENSPVIREQLLRSIKLAPAYAPSHYLLALVDFVTEARVDEALEMARKACQLAPGKASYSLLLAEIYVHRSEAAAARQILEPLARDSDQTIKRDAQELLDSLNASPAAATRTRTATPPINSAAMPEPVQPTTSRMLSGESSSVAIHDGQTIDSSGTLPSVDQLLARYLEAVGGAAALKAPTSRVIKGTVDVVGVSRGGRFETYAQAPDKIVTTVETTSLGTFKAGYNGRSGWVTSPNGILQLKGSDLSAISREADFYSYTRMKSNYAKVTLVGKSKIGYREVYVVDFQPANAAVERVYFDTKTYLPARVNTVSPFQGFSAPVEIYLDDWREVDGIKYPFSLSERYPKLTLSYTVKEIKHNVPIEPGTFDPQR